jgi:UDP-glucose 4-epimerase
LRDYIYIDDVVDLFLRAGIMRDTTVGAFNAASGESHTVGEAFKLAASKAGICLGRSVRVSHVPWPNSVNKIETRDFVSNIERAASIFGWVPQVSLETGVEKMINILNIKKDCQIYE